MKNKIIFYLAVALFIIALNLFILSAFAQVNVVLNNVPASISNGLNVTVNGNLHFNGSTVVNNSGTISLNGNWDNNGVNPVFGNDGGTVNMTGASQVIGGTSPTFFNNLLINGAGVTLNQDITTGLNNNQPSAGVLQMNNGNINLNSRELTIANSSAGGISRISGMIISETDGIAGYGRIKWKIGSQTGNYAVPFGNSVSNSLIPFSFLVTVAGVSSGTGLGSFTVSTYPTLTSAFPNNRLLPTGVAHLNNALNQDNSGQTLDRFWVLDVAGYSANPTANMTMTYRDSEHDASNGSTNTITESLLKAQRWDGTQWTAQTGNVNTISNTVSVIGTGIFNGAWALAGSNSPLPVELLSFDAVLNSNGTVDLSWVTASEINNDFFTMERSQDRLNFENIGVKDGAGNSNSTLFYSGLDASPYVGVSYYRLKQTDFNGHFSYSSVKIIRKGIQHHEPVSISAYPNPATDHAIVKLTGINPDLNSRLEIYNSIGQLIQHHFADESVQSGVRQFSLNLENLKAGIYMLRLFSDTNLIGTQKLVKK